jgi:ankyrin repeat protein
MPSITTLSTELLLLIFEQVPDKTLRTIRSLRATCHLFHVITTPAYVKKLTTYYQTPLHKACIRGNLALVNLLLRHGAYASEVDIGGTTPLQCCAQRATRDAVQIAQVLLEAGADANPDTDEFIWKTPLHEASEGRSAASVEMVKLLLEWGADPATRATAGWRTPLHICVQSWSIYRVPIATALLEAGADVNARTAGGLTALNLVCSVESRLPLMKLLAEWGAKVDARDSEGRTIRSIPTLVKNLRPREHWDAIETLVWSETVGVAHRAARR